MELEGWPDLDMLTDDDDTVTTTTAEESPTPSSVYYRANQDLLTVLRDFESDGDDDDADTQQQQQQRPQKKLKLDFHRGSAYTTVDEIGRRKLPREDGRLDTTLEERRAAESRPYGRQYRQDYLARLAILDANPEHRFVELLAGAMDKEPLDLYEEEDVERKLRERQQAATRTRLELERSIVPLEKKQAELQQIMKRREEIVAQQKQVQQEPFLRLVELGEQLMDARNGTGEPYGFLPLLSQRQRLDDVYDTEKPLPATETDPDVYETRNKKDTNLLEHLRASTEKSSSKYTLAELLRPAYQYKLLFVYLLDESSPLFIARLIERSRYTLNFVGARVAPSLKLDRTSNTEDTQAAMLIELSTFDQIFTQNEEMKMVAWAVKDEYTAHNKDYPTRVLSLLYPDKYNYMRNPLNDLNIYTGGKDGQPEPLYLLIKREGADNENFIKATMKRHFLWLYFHYRSVAGMTTDFLNGSDTAKANVKTRVKELMDSLDMAISKYKPVLTEYFVKLAQEMAKLVRDSQVPVFRLPSTTGIFLAETGDKDGRRLFDFDALNQAFQGKSPVAIITDTTFLDYYTQDVARFGGAQVNTLSTNKSALEEWETEVPRAVRERYPILALHSLIVAYDKYTRIYAKWLDTSLDDTDRTLRSVRRKIDEIARETNSLGGEERASHYVQTKAWTSLPINSGIIKLRAHVVSAMDRAYSLVQNYCPQLRGLPFETFQTRDAIESGLAGDYARFVALLVAATQLAFPSQYKTQHQQSITVQMQTEALNRLKRYSYRGGGGMAYQTRCDNDWHRRRSSGGLTAPTYSLNLLTF